MVGKLEHLHFLLSVTTSNGDEEKVLVEIPAVEVGGAIAARKGRPV